MRYAAALCAGFLIVAGAFAFCPANGMSILTYRPIWILLGLAVLCAGGVGACIDRPRRTMLERAAEVLDALREIGARGWAGAIVCQDADQCMFVSARRLGESLEDSEEPEVFAVWNPRERDEIARMLKNSLFRRDEASDSWLLLERFLPEGVSIVRLVESPDGHIFIFDYGEDPDLED